MKVNRGVLANPTADFSDEKLHRFRSTCADGVNHHNFFGSRVHRGKVNTFQEAEVGARAVHGKESYSDAVLDCKRDRIADAAQDFVP